MTQETLKQMYQLLLTEPHAPTVCAQLERIAREALSDHAMQEVQRLGQEIEQEPVAYLCENAVGHRYFRWKKPSSTYKPLALYTSPPQRTWVGLTEQDLDYLCNLAYTGDEEFALAVQAKLMEKNA